MDLEWLEAAFKTFENRSNVSKIISIEDKPAVGEGENYTSDVFRSTLHVVLHNGRKCTKSVIVKNPPTVQALKEYMGDIYKVEINVYNDILVKMEDIINSSNDPEEKPWCDMIGFTRDEKIILEDLKERDYKGANRVEMLDLKHTELLMKSLAKFHVLGKMIIDNKMVETDQYKKYFFTSGSFLENHSIACLNVFTRVVETKWGMDWARLAEKLKKLNVNVLRNKLNELHNLDCNFKVFCHGDCWTNNFLYKYDPQTNDPINVKLLDFQIVHYNSYIWDLIFFVFNSVKKDLRRTKLEDILKVYANALKEYAQLYSYEGFIPDIQNIMAKFEQYAFFAYHQLFSLNPLILSEIGHAFNIENASKKDESYVNPLIFESTKYRENVEEDFTNFYRNCDL